MRSTGRRWSDLGGSQSALDQAGRRDGGARRRGSPPCRAFGRPCYPGAMSLVGAKRRPATAADLAALPEHVIGELVGGELHASPRPGVPHACVATSLQMALEFDLSLLWAGR